MIDTADFVPCVCRRGIVNWTRGSGQCTGS